MRQAKQHTFLCMICREPVNVSILESPHPESPTMFQCQGSAWLGTVADENGGVRLLTCCSEKCTQMLLKE